MIDDRTKELLHLSDEDIQFVEQYAKLPKDIQDLFRLFMQGDIEQSLEAEATLIDILESRGHDVTVLRERMEHRRAEYYSL